MSIIGKELVRLASVDSTNNYAARGVSEGRFGHGTVILANEQTQGRGQWSRQWLTAPGLDLAMSVVLLPERFPAMMQFTLAKAAALAVHDVVAELLRAAGKNVAEVRIKWPNDILVGRSKVSGILIENELQGSFVASSVVGIGLNVDSRGMESDLAATSLRQECGRAMGVEPVLDMMCKRLEWWWQKVYADDGAVSSAYTERLWAKGRFADFTLDGNDFRARPLDVDASGRLIVEEEEGAVRAYGLERLRFKR
ncbi:MAG: biotin--[acetyl-CoA-carboxylase] ligase [Bacteroidetes bacterium]|nr:biotin--[acetyl-CoA-carboxylase] ligase [Bacteroidota bacterium]MBS1941899.1 biotin--[acetyl-CoA-carboxylase] ligase [Bacteroidota bacterium]